MEIGGSQNATQSGDGAAKCAKNFLQSGNRDVNLAAVNKRRRLNETQESETLMGDITDIDMSIRFSRCWN